MQSAVPLKTKRSALTQEVRRRLRNCHPDVPKSEVAEILSRFAQKMKNAGYNQRFRGQVINAGVLAHKQDLEICRTSEKLMFRSRKERIAQKKRSPGSQTKWWKKVKEGEKVPLTAVKVPYTAGSELLKSFQEVTKRHNFPIKFIETSGYSLQNMLERSNPFREETCGRPDCFPCVSGGGGRCDRIGAAYRIFCYEEECRGKEV